MTSSTRVSSNLRKTIKKESKEETVMAGSASLLKRQTMSHDTHELSNSSFQKQSIRWETAFVNFQGKLLKIAYPEEN